MCTSPRASMASMSKENWSPWINDNVVQCNNSTDQRGWQHCPLQRSDSFTVVEHWECQPQTTNKLNWSWLINLLNELSITHNDDNISSFARSNECWSQYGTVTMLTITTTHVGLFCQSPRTMTTKPPYATIIYSFRRLCWAMPSTRLWCC